VSGAYSLDDDRIRVQCQLIDAATGAVVVGLEPALGRRSQPGDVVAEVTALVMGAVAFRDRSGAADRMGEVARPPAYDACLEMESAWRADGPESVRRLRRAIELDPGFAWARINLWSRPTTQSRLDEADAVLRPLETPDAYSRATPLEQLYARYARALLDGNWNGQFSAMRDAARLARAPVALWGRANTELRAHRSHAAVEFRAQIRGTEKPICRLPWPAAAAPRADADRVPAVVQRDLRRRTVEGGADPRTHGTREEPASAA
jgi:hypothetical protein